MNGLSCLDLLTALRDVLVVFNLLKESSKVTEGVLTVIYGLIGFDLLTAVRDVLVVSRF